METDSRGREGRLADRIGAGLTSADLARLNRFGALLAGPSGDSGDLVQEGLKRYLQQLDEGAEVGYPVAYVKRAMASNLHQ